MEFSELILKRYSVRAYKSDPIAEDKLSEVLQAARLAPTAANRQPFQLVVIHTQGREAELRRIYDRDAYYDRVRRFLAQYHPAQHARRSLSDYLALVRSLLRQGVFSEGRVSYWKFVLEAATRYRYAFDTAITLAIMGHHFQTLTRELCPPEYPRVSLPGTT